MLGSAWDTTSVANGAYEVCNVVTDNAGHVTIASTTVTVANPVPLGAPAGAAASAASAVAGVTPSSRRRQLGRQARSRRAAQAERQAGACQGGREARAADAALGQADRRRPRPHRRRAQPQARAVGPADGTNVYRGLGSSVSLKLGVGQTGYLALFAYDHGGNVSAPARRVVSLAPLVPLRPVTGTVVPSAPRLTWTAHKGTAYYNVQLFHNGKRVLIGWPSTASFTVLRASSSRAPTSGSCGRRSHAGSAPTFGELIGRATFVVEG